MNGDGYGDVIVGAPAYDNGIETNEGGAYLSTSGRPSGLETDRGVVGGVGPVRCAMFGTSVSSAGDVNGDGYGDVVRARPATTMARTCEGKAYLYLGSAAASARPRRGLRSRTRKAPTSGTPFRPPAT